MTISVLVVLIIIGFSLYKIKKNGEKTETNEVPTEKVKETVVEPVKKTRKPRKK